MNLRAATRYRCPVTRRPLELQVIEDTDQGKTVVAGIFVEPEAKVYYPVLDGVPILLDFDNPGYDRFEERHGVNRKLWKGLRRAQGAPRPGEVLTQKTFTVEWESTVGDELTFTYSHDEREDFIRMELGLEGGEREPEGHESLDVGCGYGLETALIARITGGTVYGIDENFTLVKGAQAFAGDPHVNLALASAFAPPFEERSFDLVYSHGVLMATYDTKRAFDSIVRFAGPGGTVYIWVYALEDAQRGHPRRARVYRRELIVRPLIARLPGPLQTAVIDAMALKHYLRYRKKGIKRESWKFANSVHAIRDRWTPPFAHRHSFHEVISWFIEHGMTEYSLLDPIDFRARLNRNLFGIPVRGKMPAADREPEPQRTADSRA